MPNSIGFPAQPRHDLMSRQIADLRARSDQAREETVTGRHADPAAALDGKLTELFSLDRALGENTQYREIIDFAAARASAIQNALGTLTEISTDLQGKGQTALDSPLTVAGASASLAARHALDAVVSALNVTQAGRGLFAGNAGQGPAVADAQTIAAGVSAILTAAPDTATGYDDLRASFADPGGLFEVSLYLGGTDDAPASEIAEGERIAFAPRADAEPLRALLRDIAALATAFDPANAIAPDQRRVIAEQAIAGLRGTVQGLAILSAKIGTAEERMADVHARHSANEAALSKAYNALAGRDQFEAAAELTALEAQLETSFLTTARLSNLSLTNFLR